MQDFFFPSNLKSTQTRAWRWREGGRNLVQPDHVLWFPDHKLGIREFPDSWWLFAVGDEGPKP